MPAHLPIQPHLMCSEPSTAFTATQLHFFYSKRTKPGILSRKYQEVAIGKAIPFSHLKLKS